ncbi:MAG: DUF262 domain-containing HNH endonuclease family protein [Hyphomicrobiaceae bacterium]|nr:DUF262 domain-containing HNH endonuclease family protein [Hyphomicrobiaceae bacterium]
MPAHTRLDVELMPLERVFSDSFEFHLPWFQRAYAWQTPQASRLLANVIEMMEREGEDGFYMLGSIMLARTKGATTTAIVDGHQRTMTLTILFAVLRDMEEDEAMRARLSRLIEHPATTDEPTTGYRLQPQTALADFLAACVQAPGATLTYPRVPIDSLSETERNIIDNRDLFQAQLGGPDTDPEMRRRLVDFLLGHCHVIVRVAQSEDEAWQMLRIEETTRLDFSASDNAKASLLSVMSPVERNDASRIWDRCEQAIGPNETYAVLGHVRTLRLRRRSSAPLETDICRLFNLDRAGLAFVRDIMAPHATALKGLRGELAEVADPATAATLARLRTFMGWINPQIWVPPALYWLTTRTAAHPDTTVFFSRLDRLVWIMRIAGVDPDRQETRLIAVLADIDGHDQVDRFPQLKIDPKLRKQAHRALDSVSFRAKRFAPLVLRRLSLEMMTAAPAALPDPDDDITVEHVLPLNPKDDSRWLRAFETQQHIQDCANRIGNLSLLTFAENQEAGIQDWSVKQGVLASSRFALSRAAAGAADWTPDLIARRGQAMIEELFHRWDLPAT